MITVSAGLDVPFADTRLMHRLCNICLCELCLWENWPDIGTEKKSFAHLKHKDESTSCVQIGYFS